MRFTRAGWLLQLSFFSVPYFHVYGLCYFVRALTMGVAVVSIGRFDMKTMLTVIQQCKIDCTGCGANNEGS